MGELTKGHTQKLFPTAKIFHLVLAFMPSDKGLKLFMRNKRYDL